jgi:hypothetical protein
MTGMRWTAIWQDGWPLLAPPDHLQPEMPVAQMTLCLELNAPPVRGRKPLRLWQGCGDTGRATAVYLMPEGALRLVHGEVDVATPPDFARAGETLTLKYVACERGRHDSVDIVNADRQLRQRLRTAVNHTLRLADLLPRDAQFLRICHIAAIVPFALPGTDLSGIAAGATVATPDGPVVLDQLSQGDRVLTVDGVSAPIRWIEARPRLCLGRMAPVRLRAPYFGLTYDICVTPETRLLRSGPAVDYICGTDRVLVRAGDIASSPAARREQRHAVRVFHHLMLDDHDCIAVNGCALETALLSDVVAADAMVPRPFLADSDKTHVLPVLNRATAQALVAAGTKGRRAAG